MARAMDIMPQLEAAEMECIQGIIGNMSDDEARRFAAVYTTRRKDSTTLLLLALIGFLGFAGIHRFVLNQIGMGVLYLLTAGFCYIGTIMDLVNIKQMALDYNMQTAREVAASM